MSRSRPYPMETDDARHYGLLSEQGRAFLRRLQEHPHAPYFNLRCGDRLSTAGLARVRAFESELRAAASGWRPGEVPLWVIAFAAFCLREVPLYRRAGGSADHFHEIPTSNRAMLAAQPWSFVPDGQALDDLLVYPTSGTTGHAVRILSHPETVAKKVMLLRRALEMHGIRLEGQPGQVALVQVCFQQQTVTCATVVSYLNEAGAPKINLRPDEWRDPDDRVRFLDSCAPEVYTGDPLSFAELARLPLTTRPRALLSTSQTLLPGLRRSLEERFACPVIDVYSLGESGPVTVGTEIGQRLLPHDLYVEVLDAEDMPCPPGTRGEITLTGGRNPFLPLLRYRTGDHASLEFDGLTPMLVGLEGRPPTVFRAADGRTINNIDVTTALKPFALPQFTLHQQADGSLRLRVRGEVPPDALRPVLHELFGAQQMLRIEPLVTMESDKVIQYTSEYDDQPQGSVKVPSR